MPPEEPQLLIAVDFRLDNGELIGREERIEPRTGRNIFVSWYASSPPEGYQPACGGFVFVRDTDLLRTEMADQRPSDVGGQYGWRDTNRPEGVMFAMMLPTGYSLADPDPLPQEAKKFQDRLAVHWSLPPGDRSFEVRWRLKEVGEKAIDKEVQRINKIIFASRRKDAKPEYDVALSYASEDSEYVEQVAAVLSLNGISFFRYQDKDQVADLWGKNIYQHLSEIYSKRARYTVVFISAHYAQKRWTSHELESAQARAFVENRDYILPARFDDTEIPGLLPVIAYISLKEMSPSELAEIITKKVESSRV